MIYTLFKEQTLKSHHPARYNLVDNGKFLPAAKLVAPKWRLVAKHELKVFRRQWIARLSNL